jgi:hypothetical protein
VVCIFLVGDVESRWRGAAGSRRWMWFDGLAQGRGAIWRRGVLDGEPGVRLHFGRTS